jgi:hypothetical protein
MKVQSYTGYATICISPIIYMNDMSYTFDNIDCEKTYNSLTSGNAFRSYIVVSSNKLYVYNDEESYKNYIERRIPLIGFMYFGRDKFSFYIDTLNMIAYHIESVYNVHYNIRM